MKPGLVLACLLMICLCACAPAATQVSGNAAASFSDPFAYCTAVGTIDQPDSRYTGPKVPESIAKGLKKASGAATDMPLEPFTNGSFWRCMDGKVVACFVGANLPCESKGNPDKTPTLAMNEYCTVNPSSDFIIAAVTGRDTIYSWVCKDGKPVVDKQVFHVDARGYIQEIWYPISKP